MSSPNVSIPDSSVRGRIWFKHQIPDKTLGNDSLSPCSRSYSSRRLLGLDNFERPVHHDHPGMIMRNYSFNTGMKFITLIRLSIFPLLAILFFQSPSPADPAEPGAKSVNGVLSTEKPSSPASSPVKKRAGARKGKKVYRPPAVLERFRDYRGERTPAAFMALFAQQQTIGFRQDPPVVLSDGKAVVRLRFISTPEREDISDVALSGGRVLAAMKDPEATNTWIIEAVPGKGTYEMAMALLQREVLMVFPVAVAPPVNIDLNKSGDVTEEDFQIFLHDRGTPASPHFDLNGDGIRDFRDDYLFTANYLAQSPAPASRAATSPKIMPAGPGSEDESRYETGATVEPLPPEVEPEGDDGPPDR